MTIAVVFPGQASQDVGMGVALRAASSDAAQVFQLADEISGLPISRLCAEGPLDELTRTNVAQIAVVATSIAAAILFRERLGNAIQPAVATAGHSVGEIAALWFAGALDLHDALSLVFERGTLMERDSQSCDGTMVAVLGLDAETLGQICRDVSTPDACVQVANLNAPGQVVLSGARQAVKQASVRAEQSGARRVIALNVGGPFHSIYMREAASGFAKVSERIQVHQSQIPVVLNTSAQATTGAADLQRELAEQITRPVRWEESIRALSGLGCDTFIELGHGQVISGLIKRIVPEAAVLAIGSPEQADRALRTLQGAQAI